MISLIKVRIVISVIIKIRSLALKYIYKLFLCFTFNNSIYISKALIYALPAVDILAAPILNIILNYIAALLSLF